MIFLTDGARHLICDPYSIENLHEMAKQLGIKPCWFHRSKYPHYDVPKRRIAEIEAKCTLISSKDLLKIIQNQLPHK
jgi:signal recognition particle subunit SEC65